MRTLTSLGSSQCLRLITLPAARHLGGTWAPAGWIRRVQTGCPLHLAAIPTTHLCLTATPPSVPGPPSTCYPRPSISWTASGRRSLPPIQTPAPEHRCSAESRQSLFRALPGHHPGAIPAEPRVIARTARRLRDWDLGARARGEEACTVATYRAVEKCMVRPHT